MKSNVAIIKSTLSATPTAVRNEKSSMASSFFPSPSFLLTTALPPVANMIPTASKRLKPDIQYLPQRVPHCQDILK